MIDLTKYEIPLPDIEDKDLSGYWHGVAQGELRVQRSPSTGNLQWPPRGSAVGEPEFALEWVPVPGRGKLFSWTVVGHTALPGYKDLIPYAVGIIQLEDVPVRMLGFIDEEPGSLVADEAMRVRFAPVREGIVLPIWRRA